MRESILARPVIDPPPERGRQRNDSAPSEVMRAEALPLAEGILRALDARVPANSPA